MRCSLVLATFNKAELLDSSLESIFCQHPPFDFEVIVVDDGSRDATSAVCRRWPVRYRYLDRREPANPAVARNVGYRMARGEIVICQSDEVVHVTDNSLELLVTRLEPQTFRLARVYELDARGQPRRLLCGPRRRPPLFFLGSLWRRDLYAVGGNDEDFQELGSEDVWFTDCLLQGRRLRLVYDSDVVGHHRFHPRPDRRALTAMYDRMRRLHRHKRALAARGRIHYCSSGGPWTFDENRESSHGLVPEKTMTVGDVQPSKRD